MIDPDAAIDFLAFVEERHRIWEKRQAGIPSPWTTDPTLATRKFTCVFRVLDPGSQFVFELDTPDERDRLARLFLYRFTNLPATWNYMREVIGTYPLECDLNTDLEDIIKFYRDDLGNKVFSGAYMILPQPNRPGDKVEQAVRLARQFMTEQGDAFLLAATQEDRYEILRRTYGVGPFLAMQILTDVGYLCGEDREDEFVVCGPGSTRGLQALGLPAKADSIRFVMEMLHASPTTPALVTVRGLRYLSLHDAQNCLCEYSKYVRGPRAGTYRAAHPGPQPAPILPKCW